MTTDPRAYPDRPILAVSAAIVRDGRVLLTQRARGPANGVWTMPGGVVEAGETLSEALIRETEQDEEAFGEGHGSISGGARV